MASLRSFIKAMRKAKTIADERAVIQKESASIRTSFRDATLDQNTRRVNISKLLYLYIMGEKTHFGQVECIKLLASPRFADKRLGYLAVMLILDENQEVLTLLTNSLDNDMQNPNPFIVGQALCCLGNVASPELARDLYQNVEKIITTNNIYLRKKSCIVAAKLIEKDEDLGEYFLPKVSTLINDKSPASLLGTLRLIELLNANPDHQPELVKFIPKIVAHLKRVTSSGYIPDYDVVGVNDPFLQVSLLHVLRLLTINDGSEPYLEEINDILTQVASNIEGGKNASHSILYECVRTIFAIKSDPSLKVLGVNMLGKFLSTKDNNTRYVALDSLLTVMNIEPIAVQRHRATIVACLSDADISIRRRALELSFAILNEQNIRVLVREILTFLETCQDNELKPYITSQLAIVANKYSPNDKWHFDTLIRMLKLSGNFVTSDIISNILALILQCNDNDLKKHIVSKLYSSYLEDSTQYGLTLITVWSIGEYADLILNSSVEVNEKQQIVNESSILSFLQDILNNSNYSESETVQITTYILTAVLKLSVRFKQSDTIEQLRLILNSKTYDNNLEIQIRAIEYQEIFAQDNQLKRGLLSKMPAPPTKERETLSLNARPASKPTSGTRTVGKSNTTQDLLLDLMDDNNLPTGSTNQNDLLSDIFGGGSGSSIETKPSNNAAILDLFGSSNTATKPKSLPEDAITAFSNAHIRVLFVPQHFPGNGEAILEAIIEANDQTITIDHIQLLIAVPKSQKLTISSTTGGDKITPGGASIRQILKIVGKAGAKIKLRVKANYSVNGQAKEEQFDFVKLTQTL